MCTTSANELKHVSQVVFLGTMGWDFASDMAIDKLSISKGDCYKGNATFAYIHYCELHPGR